MKDEAGKVLCRDEEIKERWKIYFENLMNEENDWNDIHQEAQVNKGLVREINMDEIMTAVKSMKNGKALGPDDIPVEVWKLLKTDGCMWLTLFFNKLVHEETIPQEWGSCTYVRSFAGNTDQFSVAVGLHQGSALSPYLFLLIMDALTVYIQEEAPWCMLFADDIVLVGEDGLEIQSRLDDWQQKLENH
nr:uncharacterized protein LOC113400766 [Vanessa tameamea]